MTLKIAAGLTILGLGLVAFSPAQALTAKECSAKYQEAKTAGSLNGATWNQFRSTKCGDAADAAANPLKPAAAAPAKPTTTTAAAPAAAPAATNAVFPKAVDPKYAKESAGKGREKTCLDQYNANKAGAGTGNGGLNWSQKGGGYYSECNKRLKGA